MPKYFSQKYKNFIVTTFSHNFSQIKAFQSQGVKKEGIFAEKKALCQFWTFIFVHFQNLETLLTLDFWRFSLSSFF
jgi:hypothetical protein